MRGLHEIKSLRFHRLSSFICLLYFEFLNIFNPNPALKHTSLNFYFNTTISGIDDNGFPTLVGNLHMIDDYIGLWIIGCIMV